jgi:NADH-quinone oxidoreductase subunit M
MEQHVLSILIFLPIVAALGLMAMPTKDPRAIRIAALTASLFNAVFALSLAGTFVAGVGGPQFEVNADWLPSLGIRYHLGVDGLSLVLVLITTLLTPFAIFASFGLIKEKVRGYYAWLLLLSAGMVGAVVSLNVFLFYVFFELMLIPAFFLIGIWGGPNRVKATVKFVVYTIVGSLLMFVAILFLAYTHFAQAGSWSFEVQDLVTTALTGKAMWWAFAAFVLAFAIKAGLWPFHTWAPDTYVEAPAPVTFLVSGVMGKIGAYGFLRFALPLFPVAAHRAQPWLMTLALIGIIYAAWVALAQSDIKRLLAYSSISHMAVIMLGVFALDPQAWTGAVFMFMAHALGTGGLFLMSGMLGTRKGTEISAYGGIAKAMPWFTTAFLILALASIGLPGLNGFIGEFLILLGSYTSQNAITIIATTSVIWGACYMLWMISRTYFGDMKSEPQPKNPPKGFVPAIRDLSLGEAIVLVPIAIAIIGTGFFPQPLLKRIDPSVEVSLGALQKAAGMPVTTVEAAVPTGAVGGNPQ